MTSELVSSRQNDTAVWLDILAAPANQAANDLGYDVPLAKMLVDPSELAEGERTAVARFEGVMYNYALAEWEAHEARCVKILAELAMFRAQRLAQWARLETYQDIRNAVDVSALPPGSTARQMVSFLHNHLPAIEQAAVPPEQIVLVLSKGPKSTLNLSRAIAHAVKNADLTEQEKGCTIRAMAKDAVDKTAADFSKTWLNGRITVPLDEIQLPDGTWLMTFVCSDEEQRHIVNKRTEGIRAVYGNTVPILNEIRERLQNES